jgi:hypothetical protein
MIFALQNVVFRKERWSIIGEQARLAGPEVVPRPMGQCQAGRGPGERRY